MNIASLPASHGSKWISEAYREFFKKAPWVWIGLILVFVILLCIPMIVPVVGGFISNLIHPVLLAGLMHACRESEKGNAPKIDHLFVGFSNRFSELITLGVLNLLLSFATMGVSFVIGFLGIFSKWEALKNQTLSTPGEVISTVVILSVTLAVVATLFTIVAMAFWYAPLLVYFENKTPIEAMKLSFRGCLRNIWPFTLFTLAAIGWCILAAIPVGLGLLVFFPVITIADYTSYREIFTQTSDRHSPSARLEG